VVNPSDEHAIVQRIEERDSLTFASLHKELIRKVLTVVHGKRDCGATNQCRATAFPASVGSDVCVVVVVTAGILKFPNVTAIKFSRPETTPVY
jgi:hypothetical protein